MGLFARAEKKDYPPVPDNIYFLEIAEIAQKIGKESKKPYLNWKFKIAQAPLAGQFVWGITSPVITPKSRLGQWLTALEVNLAEVNENYNEQALVGHYIKGFVKTTENEDGQVYTNVHELLAMTEVDKQILQQFLAQANQAKVASAPIRSTVVHPEVARAALTQERSFPGQQSTAPVVSQPVVSQQGVAPVVSQPVVATAPTQVERKRTSSFPF
jgi:hypothetical protein